MGPVTEVVLLTLVPDADYAVVTESAKIIARQPGCLAVRTSRLLCEPDNNNSSSSNRVHYFIDWDSVDSHTAFARDKDVYQPFRDLVGTVMAGYAPPYHVALEPYPPAVFDGGGVAMVGKAWFPPRGGESDSAEEEEEEASTALDTFVEALKGTARGFDGRVGKAWSLEDGIMYKGEKGRVLFFAVGWDSVEACARFRDSADFTEAVAGVSAVYGLRGLEICLVSTEDATA
ncbi:hypothetical protein F4782DRAFT_513251 [Xylaria castorea]|nr:hypothetical protein F4782DRAFT_513251 [Xylaria castorea]